jgi:hypothetical protein
VNHLPQSFAGSLITLDSFKLPTAAHDYESNWVITLLLPAAANSLRGS